MMLFTATTNHRCLSLSGSPNRLRVLHVLPSVGASNSKNGERKETKIGVNVAQGRSRPKRCSNFQFKRLKVRVRVTVTRRIDGCIMCRHWANIFSTVISILNCHALTRDQ